MTGDLSIVFPDTNYFMHFLPLEQIDWCSHLKTKQVEIVVAPVVIRELNKHKEEHKRPHLQQRASARIKQLLSWLTAGPAVEIRPGVTITILTADPTFDFETRNLVKDIQDDWLIASILQYREQFPYVDLAVMTDDAGVVLKAHGQNISRVIPPEGTRIAPQFSTDELELSKVKKELEAYKRAAPCLSLGFPGRAGTTTLKTGRNYNIAISKKLEQDIQQLKKEMKDRFSTQLFSPNRNLDVDLEIYKKKLSLCSRLNFILFNDGTASAKDVDIHVTFPVNIKIDDEAPIEPTVFHDSPNYMLNKHFREKNQTLEIAGQVAKFKVKAAKHSLPIELDTVFVYFRNEIPSAFVIDFKITCENLVKAQEGTLNILNETIEEISLSSEEVQRW